MTTVDEPVDVVVGFCECGNPCLQEEIRACDLNENDEIVIFTCVNCSKEEKQ